MLSQLLPAVAEALDAASAAAPVFAACGVASHDSVGRFRLTPCHLS
jgi:hypothetical protein